MPAEAGLELACDESADPFIRAEPNYAASSTRSAAHRSLKVPIALLAMVHKFRSPWLITSRMTCTNLS